MARLAGDIKVTELVLVDPDQARLSVVGPFSARIMRALRPPGPVRWTADLDDGLDGAGAVLLQLRVGGQAARHRDETWPLECGCVGQETTGAGGLAKALRTVPVVLDIAERARAAGRADAWIIDFTNPVGIVTRALLDAGHRAIGLCNVGDRLPAAVRRAARRGAGPASTLDHVGLNHLTWERAAVVDGTDRLPGLHRRPRRRDRRCTPGCRSSVMPEIGARALVLPAVLLGARRGRRGAARPPDPRRGRSPRSSASCWRCTPTRRWTASPSC